MGLLGDIFSTIDSKKRQLKGLLSDPVETLYNGVRNFGQDQQGLLDTQAQAYPFIPRSQDQSARIAGFKRTPEQAKRELADAGANMGMAAITTPFKFPQDEALALAQKNAAKPISEGGLGLPKNNTPAQRAAAMGFDTEFFHGQRQPNPTREYIEGLGNVVVDQPELQAISKIKAGGGNGEGGAFFGTNDPFIANGYAKNGAVYPVQTTGGALKESGLKEGNIEAFNRSLDRNKNRYFNTEIKQAIAEGKGGAVFRNVEDSSEQKLYDIASDVYAITSAPVRSRFAAFDPARRNEADILGRIDPQLLNYLAGGGLLGAGAYGALKD